MENFVLYDEIGRGEHRIVYKGRKKGTIEYVAIHRVDKSKRVALQNSVKVSHSLKHKNIVEFFEWYETTNHLWLVVELCSGISLDTIITQDGYLPEKTVRLFGRDVIQALFYLHSNGIIYCDLVPSKVVLDSSGILKLNNFTLARFENELDDLDSDQGEFDMEDSLIEGSISRRILRGSPLYVAPELLKGGLHNKISDFWSLGCLLYECYTGTPPYIATKFDELITKIASEDIPYPVQGGESDKQKASSEFYSLVKLLLVKDSLKRIDWRELCSHPFWQGILDHLFVPETETNNFEENNMSNPAVMRVQSFDDDISASSTSQDHNSHSRNSEQESVSVSNSCDALSEVSNLGGLRQLTKGAAVADLRQVGHVSFDVLQHDLVSKENYQYSDVRELKRKKDLNASLKEFNLNSINQASVSEQGVDVGLNLNLVDLLYHPSDLEVSPIIDNRRIQKQPIFKWESKFLPFATFNLKKLQTLSKEEVEDHIAEILEFLGNYSIGTKNCNQMTAVRCKLHLLAYLCTITKYDKFTNALFETDFVKLVLPELKAPGSQDLKIRIGKYYVSNLAVSRAKLKKIVGGLGADPPICRQRKYHYISSKLERE